MFIQITTKYYCCGIEAEDGVIKKTAPILKWSKGMKLSDLRHYLLHKRILKKWEVIDTR